MRAIGKTGVAAILAVALLGVGAIVFVRSPAEPPSAAPAPSASRLLHPAPGPGSLEATIGSLQERLQAFPEDWRSYASLGLAYVAQARVTGDPSWYPKAEGALAESLRINRRNNVEGLLGLGTLALARHDFSAALRHGRRAAGLSPHGAEAYGVIGDALVELGRYDRAFEAFQTMVDTRPDLSSYARVAYARELLGDVAGAADVMESAFDAAGTREDAAWAAYQLGELAFGSGDVRTARGWYGRGLDLDPRYAPNLAGLAKVAWARGDDDLAIRRYNEVVARVPSAEFVVALGDLCRAVGREDLAARQDDVVRAMHGLAQANGVNVDLEIALFDADHGDPRGALEAARAEWARRKSVYVADALAWALYANGRYPEAAALSHRALALGTRNALFLFHAGMIRMRLGESDAAYRFLREALTTNPYFSIRHAPTASRVVEMLEARR